jgi:hypothetical protein
MLTGSGCLVAPGTYIFRHVQLPCANALSRVTAASAPRAGGRQRDNAGKSALGDMREPVSRGRPSLRRPADAATRRGLH